MGQIGGFMEEHGGHQDRHAHMVADFREHFWRPILALSPSYGSEFVLVFATGLENQGG